MFSSSIHCRFLLRSVRTTVLLVLCCATSGCGTIGPDSQSAKENSTVPQLHDIGPHDNAIKFGTDEIAEPVVGLEKVASTEPKSEPEPAPEPANPKTAVTAEAYFRQFDDLSKYYVNSKLPASELEKVAAGLRARFPFESIRDRLPFQMKTPSSKYVAGYNDRRTSALRSLHSANVATFISGEGQGLTRIPSISPADLKPYPQEYATKIITEAVGSELLSEPVIQLDPQAETQSSRLRIDDGKQIPDPEYFNQLSMDGIPKQQLMSEFNSFATSFFSNRNLGFVKNIDEVAGFEHHQLKMPADWNQNLRSGATQYKKADEDLGSDGLRWKVNRLQLVSLLMHDQPVVYVTDELPNMETLSSEDAETRGLSAFENDGLEKLKAGESMHVQATNNRIVMMGAIRSGEACRQCHAVERDELLGAFSYEFLKSPQPVKQPTQ